MSIAEQMRGLEQAFIEFNRVYGRALRERFIALGGISQYLSSSDSNQVFQPHALFDTLSKLECSSADGDIFQELLALTQQYAAFRAFEQRENHAASLNPQDFVNIDRDALRQEFLAYLKTTKDDKERYFFSSLSSLLTQLQVKGGVVLQGLSVNDYEQRFPQGQLFKILDLIVDDPDDDTQTEIDISDQKAPLEMARRLCARLEQNDVMVGEIEALLWLVQAIWQSHPEYSLPLHNLTSAVLNLFEKACEVKKVYCPLFEAALKRHHYRMKEVLDALPQKKSQDDIEKQFFNRCATLCNIFHSHTLEMKKAATVPVFVSFFNVPANESLAFKESFRLAKELFDGFFLQERASREDWKATDRLEVVFSFMKLLQAVAVEQLRLNTPVISFADVLSLIRERIVDSADMKNLDRLIANGDKTAVASDKETIRLRILSTAFSFLMVSLGQAADSDARASLLLVFRTFLESGDRKFGASNSKLQLIVKDSAYLLSSTFYSWSMSEKPTVFVGVKESRHPFALLCHLRPILDRIALPDQEYLKADPFMDIINAPSDVFWERLFDEMMTAQTDLILVWNDRERHPYLCKSSDIVQTSEESPIVISHQDAKIMTAEFLFQLYNLRLQSELAQEGRRIFLSTLEKAERYLSAWLILSQSKQALDAFVSFYEGLPDNTKTLHLDWSKFPAELKETHWVDVSEGQNLLAKRRATDSSAAGSSKEHSSLAEAGRSMTVTAELASKLRQVNWLALCWDEKSRQFLKSMGVVPFIRSPGRGSSPTNFFIDNTSVSNLVLPVAGAGLES